MIAVLLGAATLMSPGAGATTLHTSGAAAPHPSGAAAPSAVYDVRGGDQFFVNTTGRCVIGFSVTGGYVTAGACGRAGDVTQGHNRVAQGVFRSSSWPNPGSAYVAVNSSWIPRGVVNRHDGTTAPVRGGTPAPVGSAACRSGPVTGWHCGVIQARNVTVTFPQGTLYGLIRTNICAEPGEIGSPLIAGDQAQGILIAASGNCSSGGTSFYLPIPEILARHGVGLITSR
ncbi:hypothetical protein D5H75_08855 [Bailinhaonella thermotolerans]|uniref:Uncharacterized protein n=1 Tax=Bailinhaonella thermotolerans TaxID=1070861 RepID=A0A3A4B102_9ACTN|nr:hypothetical protein D5H75_08855 [Bailinhaonella thermotolerans]